MITRVTPGDVAGLAVLLTDAVDGGASLGFVKPFDADEAAHWWRLRIQTDALIWLVHQDDRVAGTISLELSEKDNGRHRAEITKLMVHRDFRGQGLGRRLLETAESAAAAAGIKLLILDTQTGSAAEALYRSAGWTHAGSIPAFAADPEGKLWPTTLFFKLL